LAEVRVGKTGGVGGSLKPPHVIDEEIVIHDLLVIREVSS